MPILAPDERTTPLPAHPEDKEAKEVQDVANRYLRALISGTREEMDEAGLRWDEMTKRKDGEKR